MVAFWVLVVMIIVGLVRGGGGRGRTSSSVRILEERYARGEIDRDEFLERRRFLLGEGSSQPPPSG
jgi:putative membrane protein